MDALPFADALVKEYLAFRGASGSLQAFCRETSAEDAAFDASRLSALLFKLIASLDVRAVVDFLDLLNSRLYSRLDARYEDVIADAEDDVLRAFVVTALTARRRDAAIAFFSSFGPQLLASSARPSRRGSLVGPASPPDWREWFVLPYLEHPERQPGFQVRSMHMRPSTCRPCSCTQQSALPGQAAAHVLPDLLLLSYIHRHIGPPSAVLHLHRCISAPSGVHCLRHLLPTCCQACCVLCRCPLCFSMTRSAACVMHCSNRCADVWLKFTHTGQLYYSATYISIRKLWGMNNAGGAGGGG